MYLTLIALPFRGSAVAGLRGRTLGATGRRWLTTACISATIVMALVAFYEVALSRSPVTILLGSWVDSGTLSISWGFTFDDLTVSMLIPVLIVSSLVHLYSINYMNGDPHLPRFMSYLSLFTAFMVLLVTGNSYLILFVGSRILLASLTNKNLQNRWILVNVNVYYAGTWINHYQQDIINLFIIISSETIFNAD
jgi:NADH-ubiquinone oxidoreductase chain 5